MEKEGGLSIVFWYAVTTSAFPSVRDLGLHLAEYKDEFVLQVPCFHLDSVKSENELGGKSTNENHGGERELNAPKPRDRTANAQLDDLDLGPLQVHTTAAERGVPGESNERLGCAGGCLRPRPCRSQDGHG